MSKFLGLIEIRDAVESDWPFIIKSTLYNLYNENQFFNQIPHGIFMTNYRAFLQDLLNKSEVKVACDKEDPDLLIGFSIMSMDYQTVHFVYVKKKWRRNGVGRMLVPAHPTYVSHLTTLGKQLLPKINNPTYNPFSI